VVLLFEPLESPVELIEVPEHLVTQSIAVNWRPRNSTSCAYSAEATAFRLSHIVAPFKCLRAWTGSRADGERE
jgi:hypothetical protein